MYELSVSLLVVFDILKYIILHICKFIQNKICVYNILVLLNNSWVIFIEMSVELVDVVVVSTIKIT